MKDMLKGKPLHGRKQSLTAIIQMHKHFVATSKANEYTPLNDQQYDRILQIVYERSREDAKDLKEIFRHMAQRGCLQVTLSFVVSNVSE